MNNPEISVVVPLFNEEECVEALYSSIKTAMDMTDRSYEVIFVDDGSSDGTFEKARGIKEKHANLRVVKFRKNYGQTPAMQAGFDYAEGNIIISMDGDMQNDPSDIPLFIEKIEEGYDIVCGWRKNRKDKLISRKIPSKIANWLIALITGIKIHDNGCSLKGYRSDVIKKTRLYSEMHRFIPAMASLSGIKVGEIVVKHHARQFGESKYGISRAWKVFLDLFLVKMIVDFASRPALWFAVLALPFMFLGVFFIISSSYLYFGSHSAIGEISIIFPSVSILFFFLSGNLLLFGGLSELILRTGDFNHKSMINTNDIEING